MYEFRPITSCVTYNRFFFQYSVRLDGEMKRARTMNRNKLIISTVREIDRDRTLQRVASHMRVKGVSVFHYRIIRAILFRTRSGYNESYRFSRMGELALHFSTFARNPCRKVKSGARVARNSFTK